MTNEDREYWDFEDVDPDIEIPASIVGPAIPLFAIGAAIVAGSYAAYAVFGTVHDALKRHGRPDGLPYLGAHIDIYRRQREHDRQRARR